MKLIFGLNRGDFRWGSFKCWTDEWASHNWYFGPFRAHLLWRVCQ